MLFDRGPWFESLIREGSKSGRSLAEKRGFDQPGNQTLVERIGSLAVVTMLQTVSLPGLAKSTTRTCVD
jgi:hypothetical protein